MKNHVAYIAGFLLSTCFISLSAQIKVINDKNIRFQTSLIEPKNVKQVGPGHYFIDFGKDAFGTLILNVKTPNPDTIIIHLGEKSINSSGVDPDPSGTIRYQKISLALHPSQSKYMIKLPADKRNTSPPAVALPDSFGIIMPFRYCEIENLKIPFPSVDIKQKVYNYNFNENSSFFTSSDTILNHVWDLCKYSIKATSFCGVYIDGDRERIPYEADAFINQLSHYSVDNEYTMARRTNEYFISNPTWPTEWILHTLLLFYYDYLYTGDIESISRHYEALKTKTLIDLEREDGLISSKSEKLTDDLMIRLGFKDSKQRIRDIVDWPPAQSETSWKLATPQGERDGYEMAAVNTVVNAFHYFNLKLMAEIAGWMGKKEDSDFFYNRSQLVKESINKKLFDKNTGIYLDGENSKHSSLHANMFPLAFGLVPEEDLKSVVSFIKTRGMACSVYGSQFLLDGLYKVNEADYAFELLTSTSGRSWWNMIRSGSTITMEAWDMKYKPNADWNHAWGAAPANIITRQLWGITPVKPGFIKAEIKPQLGNISSSIIKVPTINGPIIATYKLLNELIDLYTLEIPSGMEADFVFLPGKYQKVFLNNKRQKKAESGILALKPGHYDIELRKPDSRILFK